MTITHPVLIPGSSPPSQLLIWHPHGIPLEVPYRVVELCLLLRVGLLLELCTHALVASFNRLSVSALSAGK
jgi:hypothetical protein